MIELLASIAILAAIVAIVFSFVGNYVDYAKLTASSRTVAILNEALNEYRVMGGIAKAHSLEGATAETFNSSQLTNAVVAALKNGFTNYSHHQTFIKSLPDIDTLAIASTGQGERFRFVLNQNALFNKSSQSPVFLVADKTSIAIGESVTFTASGGSSSGDFVWGGSASGTGTTKTVIFDTAGTYTVSVYKAADTNYFVSNTASVQITVASALPAEASAIIQALLNAGATVPTADRNAIAAFVQTGLNDGWWSKMLGVYGLYYGGASAATRVNWKNPGTYNVTWSGNITYSNLGVQSSDYSGRGLLSGLTYGSGCVLGYSNIHLSTYLISGNPVYNTDRGIFWLGVIGNTGSPYWSTSGARLAYGYYYYTYGTNSGFSLTSFSTSTECKMSDSGRTHAFYLSQRSGDNQELVLNGTLLSTTTPSGYSYTSLNSPSFVLLAGSTSTDKWYAQPSADQHGFFSAGYALTSAQITSFNSAVHTLMAAFGRE
jgi:type II secretory pathway pseudopilin PulG